MRKEEPKYECSNCKCKRYTPCTCTKGVGSTRKQRRDDRMAAYNLIHSRS